MGQRQADRLVLTLRERGLDETLIRRWMDACYPAQIEKMLRSEKFAHLSVEDQAKVGLSGACGLKPGILKQRRADRDLAEQTRVRDAVDAMRRQAAQGPAAYGQQALIDEFL